MLWSFGTFFGRNTARQKRERLAARRLEAIRRRFANLKAKYDAAQTTAENKRQWALADGLSARSANSLMVRKILRERSRYECSSNSYAAGMLLTLANDMVGTGPRLQLDLPNRRAAKQIEQEFAAWARAVKLPQKLRTMRISRARDGEVFAVLTTNPNLPTPVKLDFKLIEADQVTTPQLNQADPSRIDGIRFDEHGNPAVYEILPHHPGDMLALPNLTPVDHPAAQVIHWFRADRPGQLRGVPEITPALPLYAQLRRYTLAVIAAAETAATYAGVLQTDAGPNEDDEGEGDSIAPFAELEVELRTLLTLPGGYTLSQLKAEQPVTTYDMFKHEILNEIARCLCMPFNVAAGNSAGYNYSSGRLDHHVYFRSIGIDQADCEAEVLDRLFFAWLDEAALIPGLIPAGLGPFYRWQHAWAWDPPEDLDPVKSAQARLIDLACGMTSFPKEYAAKGQDYETEHAKQAEALGITLDELRGLLRQKVFGAVSALALQQQDQTVTGRLRKKVRKLERLVASLTKGSAA